MASKRPVLFRSTRRWVMRFIIASIAVLLCLVVSPVFANANLVQQGKTFYESGQLSNLELNVVCLKINVVIE